MEGETLRPDPGRHGRLVRCDMYLEAGRERRPRHGEAMGDERPVFRPEIEKTGTAGVETLVETCVQNCRPGSWSRRRRLLRPEEAAAEGGVA